MSKIFNLKLSLTVEFDREATKEHYLSPGGYEVVAAGKKYQFDFNETSGVIDKTNPRLVHFECSDLDLDSFPETEELIEHLHEITDVLECYIYTGEYDDPEIHVKSIKEFQLTLLQQEIKEIPKSSKFITCKTIVGNKPSLVSYSFTELLLSKILLS